MATGTIWDEVWATPGESPGGRTLWLSDAVSGTLSEGGQLLEHYFGANAGLNNNPAQRVPPLVTIGPTTAQLARPPGTAVPGANPLLAALGLPAGNGMVLVYVGLAAVAAFVLLK